MYTAVIKRMPADDVTSPSFSPFHALPAPRSNVKVSPRWRRDAARTQAPALQRPRDANLVATAQQARSEHLRTSS